MDESRRRFLKDAGRAVLGVGCGFPLLEALPRTSSQETAPVAGRQLALVVDVQKCLSDEVRAACIEACRREHNIPSIPDERHEVKWIWTERYEHVFPDQVHARSPEEVRAAPVLVLCNHCDSPPCVRVCPTGATWKRETDGIVMMDMHRCIGCRYCMAACPYGARSFNWQDPRPYLPRSADGTLSSDYPTRMKGVVEKCTFCAARLSDGRPPACVEAAAQVPGGEGALLFGDVDDPTSDVSRVLRTRNSIRRRISLGTGPNVYYLMPGPDSAGNPRASE